MADIFDKKSLINILEYRKVWFCGDSNVRAIYKDFVWLTQKNTLITNAALRNIGESSHMGDRIIKSSGLTRGRNYREDRIYYSMEHGTSYYFQFLTKCLTDSLREQLTCMQQHESPDVIIMMSCLWDISRWGFEGVDKYKKNLVDLLNLFRRKLSPHTLVIWLTSTPVAPHIKGGVIIQAVEFLQESARFDLMEGNLFAQQEVVARGFDVLDLHYYLLPHIERRSHDGVHWNPEIIRYVTNLILTHISLSWNVPLPGRFNSTLLEDTLCQINQNSNNNNNDYEYGADTNYELERLNKMASLGDDYFDTRDPNFVNFETGIRRVNPRCQPKELRRVRSRKNRHRPY